MNCRCFELGGPFIDVDPSCPEHGSDKPAPPSVLPTVAHMSKMSHEPWPMLVWRAGMRQVLADGDELVVRTDAESAIAALKERNEFLLAMTRDAQDYATRYGDEMLAMKSAHESAIALAEKRARDAAIEECARICDRIAYRYQGAGQLYEKQTAEECSDAIRSITSNTGG